METVTMDFEFPLLEKIYGTFLVTLYGHLEDAKVINARSFYPDEPSSQIILSVTVPEYIAMLLKLQFSGNMRKRPPFPELSKFKMNKIMEFKIFENYNYDNQSFIKNYTDDIKNDGTVFYKDISNYHLP